MGERAQIYGGDEDEEEITSAHTSIGKHAITMFGTVCGCTAPTGQLIQSFNKMLSLSTCRERSHEDGIKKFVDDSGWPDRILSILKLVIQIISF